MDFRILGSFEVWDGQRKLELGGPKRRAVLAYLLLHANEVVAVDRLVDQLWGERVPRNAAGALHTHVSRLRKELGADVVATRAWGYVLRTESGAFDLERFERLTADAESLPAGQRAEKLREALALWRGPPLEDLAFEPALATGIARLEELRLTALENRIDADLEAGSHDGLVAELEALVADHPVRERLRGQLILALYRSGRQAEALEVYRGTRRVLIEELGIEPSPALKELERAILRQDPTLAAAPRPRAAADLDASPPRWRWPRSPLAIGSGLLALVAAGLGAALLVAERAGAPGVNGPVPANAATGAFLSLSFTTVGHHETTATGERHGSTQSRVTSTRAHTTTAVVTAQQTTTHAQHPKPPPAQWVYVLADDFEDPAFDYVMWHKAIDGSGVDAVEQGGELHFTIRADAVMNDRDYVAQHYGTMCAVTSNFDARVDFELLDWPPQNGLHVYLGVYRSPPNEAFWEDTRQGAPTDGGTEAYTTSLAPGLSAETTDSKGSLRVRRTKGVLTTYYRYRTSWVKLASQPADGPLIFILGFSAIRSAFGGQAAHIAFDNFRATADSVECNGVPLPPRKRVQRKG